MYEVCGEGCVRKSTPIRTAKTPIISGQNSYPAILYKHRLFLERLHGRMWHQQMTTDDCRSQLRARGMTAQNLFHGDGTVER